MSKEKINRKGSYKQSRRFVAFLAAAVLGVGLLAGTAGIIASADTGMTLYTGGGVITDGGWNSTKDGIYTSQLSSIPTPMMPGAKFGGWYTDQNFNEKIENLENPEANVHAAYAKWVLDDTSMKMGTTADPMAYDYTSYGVNAKAYVSGKQTQAFFANRGMRTKYQIGSDPGAADGKEADFSLSSGDDAFIAMGNDLYLARTASFEGNFVRFSYYVQNRGNSDVSDVYLGAAGDAQLGNNDFVPLHDFSSDYGNGLQMVDEEAGLELRVYTEGAGATKPDRLWWGNYHPKNINKEDYRGNTFNNGKDGSYEDGIDSAFALSWCNFSVGAGETKTFSFLLGEGLVGSVGAENIGCTVTYRYHDFNSDPRDEKVNARYSKFSTYTVDRVPDAGSAGTDREFKGWRDLSTGRLYQTGEKITVLGNLVLEATYGGAPHKVTYTVKNNGAAYTSRKVELYGNEEKYVLSDNNDGVYSSEAVPSGTYKFYIDGKYYANCTVDKANLNATYEGYEATVIPKLDGSFYSGRNVRISYKTPDGIEDTVSLKEEGEKYSLPLLEKGTKFTVTVDGMEAAETGVVGTDVNLTYKTVKVKVTKDNSVWTSAKVQIRRVDDVVTDLKLSDGVYQAPVYVKPGTTSTILINGAEQDLGDPQSAAVTIEAPFFTVTFKNGGVAYDNTTIWKQQTVLSGKTATKPASDPTGPAQEVSFKEWVVSNTGEAYDWNAKVTEPVILETSWSSAVVIPGVPTRKDDTHFTFSSLKLDGFDQEKNIASAKITVTNGTVKIPRSESGVEASTAEATNKLTVIFTGEGKTISEAETYLRTLIYEVSGEEGNKVNFEVYSK